MLTLDPQSVCDVCADEYGPFNLPRCIPCGHVLCDTCAHTIVEKTLPRHKPACPYCRDPFSLDDVRVIRIDFTSTSGGGSGAGPKDGVRAEVERAADDDETILNFNALNKADDDVETILYARSRSRSSSASASRATSRATSLERARSPVAQLPQYAHFKPLNEDDFEDEDADDFAFYNSNPQDFQAVLDPARHRNVARKLEDRVQRIAAKRCSVEEVQNLQRALTEWLAVDLQIGGDDQQRRTLSLSSALIRAILMNHVAHAEAAKVAKGVEMSLRARLAEAGFEATQSQPTAFTNQNEIRQMVGGRTTPTVSKRRASVSASAPVSPDGYSYNTGNSYGFSQPPGGRSRNHHRNHSLSQANFGSGVNSAPGSGSNSASSSGRTTPIPGLMSTLSSPGGPTSSASAAAAAFTPPLPSSGKEKSARTRTTSLYSQSTGAHRATTPTPLPRSNSSSGPTPSNAAPMLAHAHSASVAVSSASSSERQRRSMTPGPGGTVRGSTHATGHYRSASVAPGSSPSMIPPVPRVDRSKTPGLTSTASAAAALLTNTPSKQGHPNGLASAGGFSGGLLAESPSIHSPSNGSTHNYVSHSGSSISRPPVPPKPRTLSGHSGSPPKHTLSHPRAVLDDRERASMDSDRETILAGRHLGKETKEKRASSRYERWVPFNLGKKGDALARPSTAMN